MIEDLLMILLLLAARLMFGLFIAALLLWCWL
jgi:hypothetical protein